MVLVQQPANATVHNLTAFIDGIQETPPVVTTGSGAATMTLDDVTNQFIMTGTFANLIGTTTAAHVHGPAAPGVPAGILFGITFDPGVSSGNISFNGLITPAQTSTILSGNSYINIHTTFRPGGEIRGQIVPEPASVGFLALAGVTLLSRRAGRR
jgi:hypothetical protein